MKKIICLILAMLVTCTVAFVGCTGIGPDTNPDAIRSDKITEKEWREAASFMGMRDIDYERENRVEYQIMKKMSVFVYQYINKWNEISKGYYKFTEKYRSNTRWGCNVDITEFYEGKQVSKSEEIEGWLGPKSHTYYRFGEMIEKFINEYGEYVYDVQKGAYVKTYQNEHSDSEGVIQEMQVLLKFKGNRLVCYQMVSYQENQRLGTIYFIFYDYN